MKIDCINENCVVKIKNCNECTNYVCGWCGALDMTLEDEVISNKRNFSKNCPLKNVKNSNEQFNKKEKKTYESKSK